MGEFIKRKRQGRGEWSQSTVVESWLMQLEIRDLGGQLLRKQVLHNEGLIGWNGYLN